MVEPCVLHPLQQFLLPFFPENVTMCWKVADVGKWRLQLDTVRQRVDFTQELPDPVATMPLLCLPRDSHNKWQGSRRDDGLLPCVSEAQGDNYSLGYPEDSGNTTHQAQMGDCGLFWSCPRTWRFSTTIWALETSDISSCAFQRTGRNTRTLAWNSSR